MHLMITKNKYNGKITQHAKVVESYRNENNKSRKRIIMNLGIINSEKDKERFEKIIKSMNKGNLFTNIDDIKAESSKEYGVTYTTNQLLEKYNLDNILKELLSKNKAKFDVYGLIKALIINRLIKPSSELSAYDWIINDYSEKLNIQEHYLYRALDYLIEQKDSIEKQFFNSLKVKLNLNTNLLHYDLTSSYFEGKKCEIAFYGYSRDHRKDRKQIVIGLVMCDGIPIYHEVYEGNTTDKTTLKEMVKNLKEKLGLTNPTIIADRGLITEENLKELESQEYKYLLGVQRRNNNIAKECFANEINSDKQTAKSVREEIIKKKDKKYVRRYILCFDKNTQKERLETLENIRRCNEDKLKELNLSYLKSQESNRKNKMTKEKLIEKAFKIIGKNKRLFDIKLTTKSFSYILNEENWNYEKEISGKFLLVTNTNMEAKEAMKAYKEQQDVENAFDEIKNFLQIRPIEHSTEKRVRAHVFICILSYLIESIIEKFSKESARATIKELERIKIIELKMKCNNKKLLTKISKKIEDIFYELKIQRPIII